MVWLAHFGTASRNAVDARTATWMGHSQENASFVLRRLVRTVSFVLVSAEVRQKLAKSERLLGRRHQQRTPEDLPPPLIPPSFPGGPWAGSECRRRPAPAVTHPRPPSPAAHFHSTRAQRRSPQRPSWHQPPPRRRAVHELGLRAAKRCGTLTRAHPAPGHRRNANLGKRRGAGKRRRQLSRLRDHAVPSRGGDLRCPQGDAHGCSQISIGHRPPCSRRLEDAGRTGAPPTAKGDFHDAWLTCSPSESTGLTASRIEAR